MDYKKDKEYTKLLKQVDSSIRLPYSEFNASFLIDLVFKGLDITYKDDLDLIRDFIMTIIARRPETLSSYLFYLYSFMVGDYHNLNNKIDTRCYYNKNLLIDGLIKLAKDLPSLMEAMDQKTLLENDIMDNNIYYHTNSLLIEAKALKVRLKLDFFIAVNSLGIPVAIKAYLNEENDVFQAQVDKEINRLSRNRVLREAAGSYLDYLDIAISDLGYILEFERNYYKAYDKFIIIALLFVIILAGFIPGIINKLLFNSTLDESELIELLRGDIFYKDYNNIFIRRDIPLQKELSLGLSLPFLNKKYLLSSDIEELYNKTYFGNKKEALLEPQNQISPVNDKEISMF